MGKGGAQANVLGLRSYRIFMGREAQVRRSTVLDLMEGSMV